MRYFHGLNLILLSSFYGISVLQSYLYYRNYPKDSAILKLTVCIIFLLPPTDSLQYLYTRLHSYGTVTFIFDPNITYKSTRETRILDTLSTIGVADALYTYYVLDFGNLAADALIPWYVSCI